MTTRATSSSGRANATSVTRPMTASSRRPSRPAPAPSPATTPSRTPDAAADQGRGDADDERCAGPRDHPCQDVAPGLVGAERVRAARAQPGHPSGCTASGSPAAEQRGPRGRHDGDQDDHRRGGAAGAERPPTDALGAGGGLVAGRSGLEARVGDPAHRAPAGRPARRRRAPPRVQGRVPCGAARVDGTLDQVGHGQHDDVRGGGHQRDAGDEWHVPLGDGGDEGTADAGQGEHGLDDHGSGHERPEGPGGQGDPGQGRVPEQVASEQSERGSRPGRGRRARRRSAARRPRRRGRSRPGTRRPAQPRSAPGAPIRGRCRH